ncbi:MAG: hypothetical protein JWL81_697 [Verrucomicrobiales bacterium]|nr:hypothetical protein [Verrucomicrobiales bacterium]
MNNGMLDCLTGTAVFQAGFENNGILIDRNGRALTDCGRAPGGFYVTLRTHAGHNYQLRVSSDPAQGWTASGAAVAGDGSLKTFTDVTGLPRRFYRVAVSP